MSDPAKAVFLSYAREDAAAALRIAEALRGFGVEVWFDQSELRGGDQWDAKIRGQIKSCALFIPLISATTQARDEAYFRLEWKLADDRSHLMAPGKVFIVPVVIDGTPEYGAVVPESFNRAQWTRLAGGLPSTAFIEQVRRLLGAAGSPAPLPAAAPPAPAAPARPGGRPRWTWGALAAGVVGVIAAAVIAQRSAPGPAASAPPPAAAVAAPDRPASAPDKSIAVLPFVNLSAEKENEFFADGMHDDLITALAKVRDLKVISRTSVLAYREAAARNLRKIAADLGVAHVLEGSVQRAGNRVRINLQLIDAHTDAHLWAETYNRELNDIFAIQAELVQQVTGALKATLTAGEQDLLARRPTESQVAYDLYLRARLQGQAMGLSASKEDYEGVITLYEQAAAADPKFALPHVQASILHGTLYWFGNLDATPARRARVEAALEAAQRLAPDAPETHLARGSYEYTCRNDWEQALVEYRKAEAGLPNDAQLMFRMGIAHRRLGQYQEAQRRIERAISLNPSDLTVVGTRFEGLFDLRRYRQVVDEIDRFVALFPQDRRLLSVRIRARFALDNDRAAFRRDMAALPLSATDPHGLSAGVAEAIRAGDYDAAARILEDPRMPPIGRGGAGGLDYPVVFTKAEVAWLRGRPEEARRFADEAIAYFQSGQWMPRQEPDALLGVALAHAFAGRPTEALRDARTALADQMKRDAYAGALTRSDYGRILIICGRRDEALETLRALSSGYLGVHTPAEFRYEPIWSRLKDDPRFEEILRSVKPL